MHRAGITPFVSLPHSHPIISDSSYFTTSFSLYSSSFYTTLHVDFNCCLSSGSSHEHVVSEFTPLQLTISQEKLKTEILSIILSGICLTRSGVSNTIKNNPLQCIPMPIAIQGPIQRKHHGTGLYGDSENLQIVIHTY